VRCVLADREVSSATENLVGYKEQRGTFLSLRSGHFAEGHTIQSRFFFNFSQMCTNYRTLLLLPI